MNRILAAIHTVVKEVEGENRTLEFIGSNEFIDRDGEVISADGWDMKNYKKNPVILFAHDRRSPAVAKATKVWVDGENLKFKVQFPEEGVYPFADTLFKLYKGGFMNATSVGFLPKEWVDGDGVKSPRRKFTKQELLELSLVPVPANPTALLTAKEFKDAWEKNVISEKEWNDFSEEIKKLFKKEINPEDLQKEIEDLRATVSEQGNKIEAQEKKIESLDKKVSEVTEKNYFDLLLRDVRNASSSKGSAYEETEIVEALKAIQKESEKDK